MWKIKKEEAEEGQEGRVLLQRVISTISENQAKEGIRRRIQEKELQTEV